MAERDELVRVVAEALAPHTIECTGPGEVTCRCREGGWMSWAAHRTHQAAAVMDALGEHLARAWDRGAHKAWSTAFSTRAAMFAANPYRTTTESEDS